MSRCPFAVQQIIPENSTQNSIIPRVAILHQAVSSAESLYNYWTTPGVELESHFYVGQFGTIYQFMDTNIRADANVDANNFAVSIETWDGGNTPDTMPWNPAQVAAIKRLLAWLCDEHGIPRSPCFTWDGSGVGGHNWFPWPWARGPRRCPGSERNRQIREDIIPWLANDGSWDEDMTYEQSDRDRDNETLMSIRSMHRFGFEESSNVPSLAGSLDWFNLPKDQILSLLNTIVSKLNEMQADIEELQGSGIPAVVNWQEGKEVINDDADARDRDGDPSTGSPS